jgi:hypothetical protein
MTGTDKYVGSTERYLRKTLLLQKEKTDTVDRTLCMPFNTNWVYCLIM